MTVKKGNPVFTMCCTVDGVRVAFGLTGHGRPFIVCAGGRVASGTAAVEIASTLISVDMWPQFALPLLEKLGDAQEERLF